MRHYTDEQLLQAQLFVEDPLSLDNVLHTLPQTVEVPEIEAAYDTRRTTKQLIPCVHCGHPNHNAGFVMCFEDGKRMLVGNRCGRKLYGADFAATEKNFNMARNRADYLRRRRRTLDAAPTFRVELACLLTHTATRIFADVKTQLNTKMPELVSFVGVSCRDDGGGLFVDNKVRDLEAEAHREEIDEIAEARTGRKPPKRQPIYKIEPRLIWTVSGQEFWRVDSSPSNKINSLLVRADKLLFDLGTKDMGLLQFGKCFKDLGDLVEEVRAEINRLRNAQDAFELRNLDMIAKWATGKSRRGRYAASIGTITWTPTNENPATVKWPSGYALPQTDWVESFRAALSGI